MAALDIAIFAKGVIIKPKQKRVIRSLGQQENTLNRQKVSYKITFFYCPRAELTTCKPHIKCGPTAGTLTTTVGYNTVAVYVSLLTNLRGSACRCQPLMVHKVTDSHHSHHHPHSQPEWGPHYIQTLTQRKREMNRRNHNLLHTAQWPTREGRPTARASVRREPCLQLVLHANS